MDSDIGKLFIGGISWETSEDHLTSYFKKYGDVQSVVMRDKGTGKPRGFAFVVFSDPNVVDTVLQDQHVINGRTVEAKRAMSREEQHTNVRSGSSIPSAPGQAGADRTKKIFVGGLPQSLTEDSFRQYFESYGQVTDVVVMYDQSTQRPRGFGFISFDTEEAVDRVLHKTFHDLNGKQVEVKRALPKDSNSGGGSRSSYGSSGGGFGNSGGGYGYGNSGGGGYGYGNSGGGGYGYGNSGGGGGGGGGSGGGYSNYGGGGGGYDSRSDMPAGNPGGGFPSYGSGYGYGPGNGGMGYGGGGAAAGYAGPGSGSFGTSPASGGGYPGNQPRGSWGSQSPSGFGGSMYGNSASWGSGGGGIPSSGPVGQPQNQNLSYGYNGYGGYNGGDGSQGNAPAGYGGGFSGHSGGPMPAGNAAGGGGEYMGSGGYGNDGGGGGGGNVGYNNNAGWRSDQSQIPMNYGGQQPAGGYGYAGGSQPRLPQQQ